MSAEASVTVPVAYSVVGVEAVHGAGQLAGLTNVELDLAGVVLTLQGVQVRRLRDGQLECSAPAWRHPRTGQSVPAAILPETLSDAIAAEVLSAFQR